MYNVEGVYPKQRAFIEVLLQPSEPPKPQLQQRKGYPHMVTSMRYQLLLQLAQDPVIVACEAVVERLRVWMRVAEDRYGRDNLLLNNYDTLYPAEWKKGYSL